jgi:hypothetical protein
LGSKRSSSIRNWYQEEWRLPEDAFPVDAIPIWNFPSLMTLPMATRKIQRL